MSLGTFPLSKQGQSPTGVQAGGAPVDGVRPTIQVTGSQGRDSEWGRRGPQAESRRAEVGLHSWRSEWATMSPQGTNIHCRERVHRADAKAREPHQGRGARRGWAASDSWSGRWASREQGPCSHSSIPSPQGHAQPSAGAREHLNSGSCAARASQTAETPSCGSSREYGI